jgi:ABC-type transport system involved in cytochrome bd biosynthesis fused ATPase/permease subunit
LDFALQTLLSKILSGTSPTNTIRGWSVVLLLIHPIVRFGLFGKSLSSIVLKTINELWRHFLDEYDTIAHADKGSFSIIELRRKVGQIEWGVRFWLDTGFASIVELFATLYLTFYTFIQSGSMWLLFALVFADGIIYLFVKRRLDARMLQIHRDGQDQCDVLVEKLRLELPKLEWRSKSVDNVMPMIQQYNEIETTFAKTRTQQVGFGTLVAQLSMAVIMIFVDSNLVGLLSVTTMFTSIVLSLFNLINNNVYFEDDLARLTEKFAAVEKKPRSMILPLPDSLDVTNCEINKGKFSLVLHGELSLVAGMKILITGPSGGGKTTFLGALFGLEKGVTLSEGLPENYFGHVAQMYQSIKENLQVENLSIRQVFNDEKSDVLIEQCLFLSQAGKWIDRKKNAVESYHDENLDSKDVLITVNESYLDKKIGRLSGGEKTRLAIAMILYELEITGKQILILDEPEQGSDPPIAYNIIKSIVGAYPDRIIIVISHLEQIRFVHGVVWDKFIHVDNGVVEVSD